MELSFQHGRKRMRRMTKFEYGKGVLPQPKPGIDLPFDVISSILTRIPARHLLRMRSVCRSWNLLISDSHFIREYSNNRAHVAEKPCIVSLYRDSRCLRNYSMKFFPQGDDNHHKFDLSRVLVGPYYSMSNSCDGLICVLGLANMYIVNPSIQKLRELPTGSWHWKSIGNIPLDIPLVGLGFDDCTGEYKAVRIFRHKVGCYWRCTGCEVYSFRDFHSPSYWKVIEDSPLEPSPFHLPVFFNGAIHWTANNDVHHGVRPEVALSFDIKSEKFFVILHPEGSSRPPSSIAVELGGRLCLAVTHPDGMQMDIWILKEYSNSEWIKQYCIDLMTMYDHSVRLSFRTIPVTIHNGKIIFCNDNGRRDYYDPESKRFVKCEYVLTCSDHVAAAYSESIVWPRERVTV